MPDIHGPFNGTADIGNTGTVPICFTRGMKIEVEGDEVVEDLELCYMVRTLDNGCQPVRFIYAREMATTGAMRHVVFEPRTINNDKPVIVSQAHRIYTTSMNNVHPEYKDYLIEAKHLANNSIIFSANEFKAVEYFHLMFDNHELIYALGSVTKSWQPHRRNLKSDKALKEELPAIFPEIAQKGSQVNLAPKRKTIGNFFYANFLRKLDIKISFKIRRSVRAPFLLGKGGSGR